MKFYKVFIITFLSFAIFSCGSEKKPTPAKFTLQVDGKTQKFQLNAPLKANIINTNNGPITAVEYSLNDQKLENSSTNPAILETTIPENMLLGKQLLKASVTYGEGKTVPVVKNITVLSNSKPKIYTYKIVQTYPHDIKAYTQGLEFFRDTLFESTGQYRESSLRKVDYKTGKIYQKIDLEAKYFGEGITVLHDTLYMLTWRSNTGFVFNPDNLEKIRSFSYKKSKQGWGLCTDGEKLYKSDGTEKIWILDPKTLTEQYAIQVCDNKRSYVKSNELEYVNGKIYANSYTKPSVMIINPKNGALEGIVDFRGLKEKVTNHSKIDVFNGIAYNSKTNTYFVTGKYWDKLFEVEIVEK
ncbi:glutamine cyclotransferase [Kordia sp. SMS9]|uniref:glutaminyl-peptide cyclotransferase n=1 Tax=Kordia sp. SMS9 TaxID=2282170 RepID=UPI000E0D1AED|nr:glutaminyl-peptide cyclotransferase [Kordia sp. SMS9]AXG71235.1 glutamine cyclotransferase [Kordia sp. SMS9]